MTDFEFNQKLIELIKLCDNKSIKAGDIGDFFSQIYGGVDGNTFRIRLFLPAVLKISQRVYQKCYDNEKRNNIKIYIGNGSSKEYYLKNMGRFKHFEKQLKKMNEPTVEFMMDIINYMLKNKFTDDSDYIYRVIFTSMRDDISQKELKFTDDDIAYLKKNFEQMISI